MIVIILFNEAVMGLPMQNDFESSKTKEMSLIKELLNGKAVIWLF